MNGKIEAAIDLYSRLLFKRPGTVILVALLATAVLASGASKVETVEQSQEDILPDSVPTMQAFETVSSEFSTASGTSYTILLETDPDYPGSNEIRDMRNPEALRFMESISNDLEALDRVTSVTSPADLFRDIPSSKAGVQEVLGTLGEERWQQRISSDYQAAVLRIDTVELTAHEEVELAQQIRQTVRAHKKPAGIQAGYTGQPFIDEAFQRQTQKTMSLTGTVALLGVALTVIILFRSVFYGLNSLLALVFGIATGFGLFGWLGLDMSPATSGALTMGIGVAIDFGIQPIARYIEEREESGIENALSETVKGVVTPMTVGLVAANIGFMSLNFGRVTFLSDLGVLLTLTTTMAYVAAFTVIPPALVLFDRYLTGSGTHGLQLPGLKDTTGETQP
ncbi:MAG: MMPL family transporter [Candidatus Nanohaloarchaea archaeon]